MRVLAFLVLLAASTVHAQSAPPARYVLDGARIYTADAANSVAEALAVDGGRIVAVGTRAEMAERFAGWPRLDVGGRTVIPGLIDAHAHLMGLGLGLLQADLVGTTSVADIRARIVAFAATAPAGAWITGRGWDQNDWNGDGAFPTRQDLDAALGARPVWIERVDGHAGWANTAAMVAAGIDPDAVAPADPPGGQIVRDARGRPTGVFVDAASLLVEQAVPKPDAPAMAEALRRALAETTRSGLTGVHEAGIPLAVLSLYRDAIASGRFPVRLYAMIEPDAVDAFCAANAVPVVDPSGRLVVRAVKVYADGALGSRGAALLADYSDRPGHRGLVLRTPAALQDVAERAMRCGLQVNTHAIGDAANRVVLDAYASAIEATGAQAGRHRIEHAQLLSFADIERFAALGVIASVQPTHATSDMPWVETRVGPERIAGAYAWRRLADSGARLALGSDFPVERVSPILGFHAAVTRQDAAGMPAGGWFGNQALTRVEALRGFTIDAAYAGFMEAEVGSLEPGKRADFVVLSQDLMTVPPERILATRVVATYLDGAPVYQETP